MSEIKVKSIYKFGNILFVLGIMICLIGMILSTDSWRRDNIMINIGEAKITILKGKEIYVGKIKYNILGTERERDRWETKGEISIPLRYVLAFGIFISGMGIVIILLKKGHSC